MALIERSRPEEGFISLQQVQHLGLNQLDLEALAGANAFAQLRGNRYQARWDLMKSLDHAPLWDAPQNKGNFRMTESEQSAVQFHAPDQWQSMQEDYQSTGLSLDSHPVALLRQSGLLQNDIPANALSQKPHKSCVSVCGLVTGKQSPGTAAGVSFYTLEDETGSINVVIWRATARAQKLPYLRARLLRVVGILEQEAGVIHIIAGRLEDLSAQLDGLRSKIREFH